MKHIINVLVENKPGVLARISGLFSARGFNINSLAVGETESPDTSRMTLVVEGDDRVLEQVAKQLHKLIDVIKITDFVGEKPIARELLLVKVSLTGGTKPQILQIVNNFPEARIADVGEKTITIEIVGEEDRIQTILDLLRPFGIKTLSRTGKIALPRGSK
jgi:acetolactate synthase-1/3 small subunit